MTTTDSSENVNPTNQFQSLGFKLLAPVVAMSILILAALAITTWNISQEHITTDVRLETHFITETLVISADADASTKNLVRIVNTLAADKNIEHLSLINPRTGLIVADNHNQWINRPAQQILPAKIWASIEKHLSETNHEQYVDEKSIIIETRNIMLIDPLVNRLRPYIILLAYNTTAAQHKALSNVFETTLISFTGIIAMLFGVYFILHTVFLKRIGKITAAIEKQHRTNQHVKIDIGSQDELGRLANAYNQLHEEKQLSTNELQKTRHYVDGITNASPTFLAYLDAEERFQFANSNFEPWFGLPFAKAVGEKIETSVPDNLYAVFKPHLTSTLAGHNTTFNCQLLNQNSSIRQVKVSFSPDFSDELQTVQGIFVSMEDISAAKAQTKILQELSLRLEIAIKATGFGVWDYDLTANTLLWDARMYELFDTSRGEFPNPYDAWKKKTHVDDFLGLKHLFNKAVRTNQSSITANYRAYKKNGIRYLQSHAEILRDPRGVGYRIIGTALDVTELKLSEQQSEASHKAEQASSARIEAILNSAAEAILTINIDGEILAFNRAAETIFGYTAEEIIGSDISQLMPSPYREHHHNYISAYLTTGQTKIIGKPRELQGLRSDGEIFPIALSVTEVDTQEGRLFTGLVRDISLEKKLAAEREMALAKAQESSQLKSAFLASMSHEIRTPMNGVIGMLDLMIKSQLNEKQNHYAKLARSSADSLLVLINDILDFSKIEAGKLDIETIAFNIRQEFDDFAEAMAHKAQEKDLEFVLDLVELPIDKIEGDPSRIRQMLANLISNAIKFTEQGQIVVKLSLTDRENSTAILHCSVTDSGIGIPPERIDNLFDSFTQADASTTRKYGGTGLGLAITKQLSEMMGGGVKASSEVGEGSNFEFFIKVKIPGDAKPVQPPFDVSNIHLLIVDDNQTNRECIQRQLSLWGTKVSAAGDSQQALAFIDQQTEFSAIIIDRDMRGVDGISLSKALCEHENFDREATKLILMVPLSANASTEYYQKLGFAGYFPKPATTDDLFKSLAVVLEIQAELDLLTNTIDIQPPSEQEQTSIHLLLVEDNPINQEVALGLMEEFNLLVDVADNGEVALKKLNNPNNTFDIILMDCQMPVMDGFKTSEAIRANQAGPGYENVPIIALTANAMKGDKERCLKSGMNDYLSKPLDAQQLQQVLNKWSPIAVTWKKREPQSDTVPSSQATIDIEDPIWDQTSALQRVRNKPERLAQLIELFLRDMPSRVDELKMSVEAKDLNEIAFIAHTIKGVSANLSGLRLQRVAAELEAAAKLNDAASIDSLWSQLENNYSQLQDSLKSFN